MSIIPSQKLALAEAQKLNSHNVKSSDPERRNQWSDSSEYAGLVGAKLQNATSDFFELDLSKKHSPVKWLP